MADFRNQLPLNSWQQYQQGLNQQFGVPGMREPWGYRFLSPYQQFEENYKTTHPTGGRKVTPEQVGAAESEWYGKWAQLTKGKNSQLGIPMPPIVPPDKAAKAGKVFSLIDQSKTPEKTANDFANQSQDPDIKKMILLRGRMAQMKLDAQNSQTLGAPPGGSNDGGPPAYLPY